MEITDRTIARVSYQSGIYPNSVWFECYLHESNLADHPYVVVERTGQGNKEYVMAQYDSSVEANIAYGQALARTKRRILDALV